MKLPRLAAAGVLLALAAFAAPAQTLLGGAEISHKFRFGLNLGAGVEYRTMDWLKHTDQWSAELSASFKPVKPLKLSVSYKFIQAQTLATEISRTEEFRMPAYWADKHRVSVSATGEWKPIKILTLSLRERYQYTYRPSFLVPRFDDLDLPHGNKTINAKSKHIVRSRLMAEVKPYKKCRLTPYVSWELYSLLSDVNHTKERTEPGRANDKWRLTVGTDFKINKKNSLELFYRYSKVNSAETDDVDQGHTIGLVYSFKI